MELLRTLRDGSTLMMMGFPVLLYPAMIWAMSQAALYMGAVRENEVARVALIAGDEGPDLAGLPMKRIEVGPGTLEDLDAGRFDLAVERVPDGVRLHHRAGSARSRRSLDRVEDRIEHISRKATAKAAVERGAVRATLRPYELEVEPIDDFTPLVLHLLGLLACAFVPMSVVVSTYSPVIELFVAERERGSLETTLCVATSRRDLVVAKLAAAALLGTAAALANLGALWLTLAHGAAIVSSEPVELPVPGLGTLFAIVVLVLSAAVLVAVLMAFAVSVARTHREAQTLSNVVLLPMIVPAMGAMLAVIADRSADGLYIPIAHTGTLLYQTIHGGVAPGDIVLAVGMDVTLVVALFWLWMVTLGPTALIEGIARPAWLARLSGESA
ncbi:MAG: ABC transporter permease [Myxococcota bacterium]